METLRYMLYLSNFEFCNIVSFSHLHGGFYQGHEDPHEQRIKERPKSNFLTKNIKDYVIKKTRTQKLKLRT